MKKRNNYYTWCILLAICLSTSCDEPRQSATIAAKRLSSVGRVQSVHAAKLYRQQDIELAGGGCRRSR